MLEGYPGEDLYSFDGNYLWYEALGGLNRYRVLCQGDFAKEVCSGRHGLPRPVQNRSLAELLRIEAGQPGMGSEIKADTIPLEVGLGDHISFSKGCYIGQEIIARMESRGKMARTLVRVRADSALKVGRSLIAGGRRIGVVTSAVHSPEDGWIGLALVKPGSRETEATIITDESNAEIFMHPLAQN